MLTLTTQAQPIRAYGFKVNVTDLAKAEDFYCGKLGFQIESKVEDNLFLKSEKGSKMVIHKVRNLLEENGKEANAGFSMKFNDLDQKIADLKSKGVDFGNNQKRKEGVGYAISVPDPFGKLISLMQITKGKQESFVEPYIYNYGFHVHDMDKAIEFYSSAIGFKQLTQNYMPLDMPLGHQDGSFGFMLHFREGTEAMAHNSSDSEHVVILFSTPDLETSIKTMKERGVKFLQKKPVNSPLGKMISFFDPAGYLSDLIEIKP